jgi:hypothetical protein
LNCLDLWVVRSLWSNQYVNWVGLDAVNTAGGILIMWDKRVVEKLDVVVGRFSVSCHWRGLVDGFDWVCSGVYESHSDEGRNQFWEELSNIRQRWAAPWCVVGDFNIIRFPSERLGCSRLIPAMINFLNWIDSSNLVAPACWWSIHLV